MAAPPRRAAAAPPAAARAPYSSLRRIQRVSLWREPSGDEGAHGGYSLRSQWSVGRGEWHVATGAMKVRRARQCGKGWPSPPPLH
jgi:hypothetical protein